MASFVLIIIKDLCNFRDGFVVAGIGAAEDYENAYSVFVDIFADEFGVKAVVGLFGNGEDARFDFKIAGESIGRASASPLGSGRERGTDFSKAT